VGCDFEKGDFMRRFLLAVLMGSMIFALLPWGKSFAATRLQEVSGKVVIVIDPGHGGENLGTTQNGHMEKEMTMTTALAMYEELLLYDNVEVYLTHTDDRDLSLKKRAQFAKSVNADFLFSIHYNASENHDVYGSEVWVSAFAPYNGYGYQFGCEILTDFKEMGLLVRGVKTRYASNGQDYYGIIRESVELDVPAVIIEHCHVDEESDAGYCDEEEKLKAFGQMDATAVARYFGLKSSILNVDYSTEDLREASADKIVMATLNDTTAPEVCQIEFSEIDYDQGRMVLQVIAADYDSALLYYSCSLDGGRTFGERQVWPGSNALTGSYEDTFQLPLDFSPGTRPEVIVRAYNQYDFHTESNCLVLPETFSAPQRLENATGTDSSGGNGNAQAGGLSGGEAGGSGSVQSDLLALNKELSEEDRDERKEVPFLELLAVCLGIVSTLFLLLSISQGIAYHNRRKRRVLAKERGGQEEEPAKIKDAV